MLKAPPNWKKKHKFRNPEKKQLLTPKRYGDQHYHSFPGNTIKIAPAQSYRNQLYIPNTLVRTHTVTIGLSIEKHLHRQVLPLAKGTCSLSKRSPISPFPHIPDHFQSTSQNWISLTLPVFIKSILMLLVLYCFKTIFDITETIYQRVWNTLATWVLASDFVHKMGTLYA